MSVCYKNLYNNSSIIKEWDFSSEEKYLRAPLVEKGAWEAVPADLGPVPEAPLAPRTSPENRPENSSTHAVSAGLLCLCILSKQQRGSTQHKVCVPAWSAQSTGTGRARPDDVHEARSADDWRKLAGRWPWFPLFQVHSWPDGSGRVHLFAVSLL